MARQFAWMLAAALLAGSTSLAQDRQTEQPKEKDKDRQSRDSRQDQNRWKWWINPEHRKELGITDEQSKQIDEIFESMFPKQRAIYREAEKLESQVARIMKDGTADVAAVAEQVRRLETLHAERRAMRTIMLYRINLVLTAEQRTKLEQFRENRRRDGDRRR